MRRAQLSRARFAADISIHETTRSYKLRISGRTRRRRTKRNLFDNSIAIIFRIDRRRPAPTRCFKIFIFSFCLVAFPSSLCAMRVFGVGTRVSVFSFADSVDTSRDTEESRSLLLLHGSRRQPNRRSSGGKAGGKIVTHTYNSI